jgi:hypothetical protein
MAVKDMPKIWRARRSKDRVDSRAYDKQNRIPIRKKFKKWVKNNKSRLKIYGNTPLCILKGLSKRHSPAKVPERLAPPKPSLGKNLKSTVGDSLRSRKRRKSIVRIAYAKMAMLPLIEKQDKYKTLDQGDPRKGVPKGNADPFYRANPDANYKYDMSRDNPTKGTDTVEYGATGPGASSYAIPYNSDVAQGQDFRLSKSAYTIMDIMKNTGEPIKERAQGIPVAFVRRNLKKKTLVFKVGRWKVFFGFQFQDEKPSNIRVTCTCPFWQWQGPEHWGDTYKYLYAPARGSKSPPSVKDPGGKNIVCKHVIAVINHFRSLAKNSK